MYGDGDKYIKTKIKVYGDRVNTNFQGKKVPKENASYKCLSLIMLDSVIRANKKYYPQTLLDMVHLAIHKAYIIKKPFYLLKINKRTNKKYICNTLLLTYLHL